eukprot:gene28705-35611_t
MTCPQYKIGGIIGTRGAVIFDIINKSGCRIEIDKTIIPESEPRKVELIGRPEHVDIAMEMITEIINKPSSHFATGGKPHTYFNSSRMTGGEAATARSFGGRHYGRDDSASGRSQAQQPVDFDEGVEFLCPQSKVGLVIGYKGTNVKDILSRTGCKVTIDDTGPLINGTDRVVNFSGNPMQIAAAKALVRRVIAISSDAPPPRERQSHHHHTEYREGRESSYGSGRGGAGEYEYGSGETRGGGGCYAPPVYGAYGVSAVESGGYPRSAVSGYGGAYHTSLTSVGAAEVQNSGGGGADTVSREIAAASTAYGAVAAERLRIQQNALEEGNR